MLKKLYYITAFTLFACVLFVGLDRLCHHGNSKFNLAEIRTSNLFSPRFSIPPLSAEQSEELNALFRQKFLLYHKGIRSYAFISEDGNYVLHFLHRQQARPQSWLSYLPFSFNPYYQQLCVSRRDAEATMQAWHQAFLTVKEEMALVYLHFDNQHPLHKKIHVLDKDLEPYTVDLDKTLFYVQRHADLFYLKLADLVKHQEWESAKTIIASVHTLIKSLFEKGALDTDQLSSFEPSLVGNRAVQLDIGPFYPRDRLPVSCWCHRQGECDQVLLQATKRLTAWLEKNAPELLTPEDDPSVQPPFSVI